MKWRKSLTIMEATMLACDYKIDQNLFNLERIYEAQVADWICDQSDMDDGCPEKSKKLYEAREIYNGLIEETYAHHEYNHHSKSALTVARMIFSYDAGLSIEEPEQALYTRESLAQWFYDCGDSDKAKIILPSFTNTKDNIKSLRSELKESKKQLEILNSQNQSLQEKLSLPHPSAKQSSKPYLLIAQLIKLILPDADFKKSYQVHGKLSQKLIGDETLAVSEQTLKSYFEKL